MFKKILLIVAVIFSSVALFFFEIIYITQPTNAAISPTLPQKRIGIEERMTIESKVDIGHRTSNIGQSITRNLHPPTENIGQADFFDFYLFREYFNQEGVDFRLPISDSFALVSNFPGLKKQEEGNNPVFLVNFDQNALVGLRYTHQGAIWDTKIVGGLAGSDGGYGFTFCLTKNF